MGKKIFGLSIFSHLSGDTCRGTFLDFLTKKKFSTKNFWTWTIFEKKIFGHGKFLTKKFLALKFLDEKFFALKTIFEKKNLTKNFFGLSIFSHLSGDTCRGTFLD